MRIDIPPPLNKRINKAGPDYLWFGPTLQAENERLESIKHFTIITCGIGFSAGILFLILAPADCPPGQALFIMLFFALLGVGIRCLSGPWKPRTLPPIDVKLDFASQQILVADKLFCRFDQAILVAHCGSSHPDGESNCHSRFTVHSDRACWLLAVAQAEDWNPCFSIYHHLVGPGTLEQIVAIGQQLLAAAPFDCLRIEADDIVDAKGHPYPRRIISR